MFMVGYRSKKLLADSRLNMPKKTKIHQTAPDAPLDGGEPIVVKRPVGRPTKYSKEIMDDLLVYLKRGYSLEAAAYQCGIGARTLFDWKRDNKEFSQFIEEHKPAALVFWENKLLAAADDPKSGNNQLISLAVRNRSKSASGWMNDTQKVEVTGKDGSPIAVEETFKIDVKKFDADQRAMLKELILSAKAGAGNEDDNEEE